jgi:hypothetical protein
MRKRVITVILFIALIMLLTSCNDAEIGRVGDYGNTIQVLGPDTILEFQSSGKVLSKEHSDGYYFTDAKTGKLVEVSGTVIISEN